jgi:hypothetical protein
MLGDTVDHHIPSPLDALDAGQAHRGMLGAARNVVLTALPVLSQALQTYTISRLVFVGHSLGGGISALSAYLLNQNLLGGNAAARQVVNSVYVAASCFSAPPVLDPTQAQSTSSYITNVYAQVGRQG